MTKKQILLPTLVALFLLLLISLIVGLIINRAPAFLLRASPTIQPQSIQVVNQNDHGFSVIWTTTGSTQSALKYGLAANHLDLTLSESKAGNLHFISPQNLQPQTHYYFNIISAGKTFDNTGLPFETQTAPTATTPEPANNLVYGQVNLPNGQPAVGIIVTVNYPNMATQATLTTASGTWAVPLHLARATDLSTWFTPTAAQGTLTAEGGGSLGQSVLPLDPTVSSPVPIIILGQNSFPTPPPAGGPTKSAVVATSRFSVDNLVNNNPVLTADNADLPVFTASGSATLTSTPTPTPTIIPRIVKPPDTANIPKSGNLTPTLALFMMGIGLVVLGLKYGHHHSAQS